MKISKKSVSVKAAEEVTTVDEKDKVKAPSGFTGKYAFAQEHIMEAIKELTNLVAVDSEDDVASDSIANLSVVLLDLQGGED